MLDDKTLRFALVAGTAGSLASAAALALAARAEGAGALQPLNATSHWRFGPAAAARRRADWAHTGTGYATHHAACIFWALLFAGWRRWRRGPDPLLAETVGLAVVAAAVDYGPTPARFTPGWEFVLSRKGMALAYLALGLAVAASGRPRGPG